MLEFFYKGGLLMYPILVGSILTVAFGMERAFHYIRARSRNGSLSKIKSLIEQGEYNEAHTLAKETPGPVSAVIAEALQHKRETQLAIEEAVSLKGSSEIKKLGKNLHILELTSIFVKPSIPLDLPESETARVMDELEVSVTIKKDGSYYNINTNDIMSQNLGRKGGLQL